MIILNTQNEIEVQPITKLVYESNYNIAPTISYDTRSMWSETSWTNGSTQSWNHTMTNQNNRCLIIYTLNTTSVVSVTGVKYNNIDMTKIFDNVSTYRHTAWILTNPTTGTSTAVVTFNNNSTGNVWVGASSYYNVNQSSPYEQINFTYTTSLTAHTLNTYVSGSTNWVVGCATYLSSVSAETWDNPFINRGTQSSGTGAQFYDSNGFIPPGNKTVRGTSASAQQAALFAVVLKSS